MGLFNRLFGKKEEPKIEEVVKEALENLDLSEDTEAEEVSQEEAIQVEEVESPQVESSYVEDMTSSDEEEEDFNQLQSDETEPEITEEVEEDLVIEETPLVEETVQEKYDRSLKKTRTGFGARLNAFFANFRSVDEEFFEELEELLIMSDVGVQVASNLTEELRYEAKLENAKKPEALRRVIIEKLVELYEKDGIYNENINFQDGLTVMLFVGVNGVGKTTSIGKLANRYKQAGKKVMLVAADTFRAGAVAQLAEWGRRVGVPVVTGPEKADPASVVFDGMERAVAEGIDIHGLAKSKGERSERVYKLLEQVGLNKEHANRFVHEFSGGQRQRIGIARALAVEPKFILCDEPISALDVSIQAQIANMLIKFQKELGLTYLFIAHDLAMVKHISDRVAVMYLGSMVELAESEALYSNPKHPYTEAIMSAIPIADPDVEEIRQRIMLEGDVPSPINTPPGCKFQGRCSKCMDICKKESPLFKEVEKDHYVACHLYD